MVVTTCVVTWVGVRRLSMVGVVVVSVACSSERGIVIVGLSRDLYQGPSCTHRGMFGVLRVLLLSLPELLSS